ncbi:MAG: hypothetical protein RR263_02450, partial [Oscillospiraceae bacterium]
DMGMRLEYTDEVISHISNDGYDPAYGARPLRRKVQSTVEDKIADAVLKGEFVAGDTLVCDYTAEDGYILVKK